MTFPEKKDGETASVRHLVASVDPKSGRPALVEVAVVVGNVGRLVGEAERGAVGFASQSSGPLVLYRLAR